MLKSNKLKATEKVKTEKEKRGKSGQHHNYRIKIHGYIPSQSPLIKGRGELHNLFFYLLCGGCILSPLHLFTFTWVGKVGYSRLK